MEKSEIVRLKKWLGRIILLLVFFRGFFIYVFDSNYILFFLIYVCLIWKSWGILVDCVGGNYFELKFVRVEKYCF